MSFEPLNCNTPDNVFPQAIKLRHVRQIISGNGLPCLTKYNSYCENLSASLFLDVCIVNHGVSAEEPQPSNTA